MCKYRTFLKCKLQQKFDLSYLSIHRSVKDVICNNYIIFDSQ